MFEETESHRVALTVLDLTEVHLPLPLPQRWAALLRSTGAFDPLAFTSLLQLQLCATKPGLYVGGDGTRGLDHARHILCPSCHF